MAAIRLEDLSRRTPDPWGGLERTYQVPSDSANADGYWIDLPTWCRSVTVRGILQAQNSPTSSATADSLAATVYAVSRTVGAKAVYVQGRTVTAPGVLVSSAVFFDAQAPAFRLDVPCEGIELRWGVQSFPTPPDGGWYFGLAVSMEAR